MGGWMDTWMFLSSSRCQWRGHVPRTCSGKIIKIYKDHIYIVRSTYLWSSSFLLDLGSVCSMCFFPYPSYPSYPWPKKFDTPISKGRPVASLHCWTSAGTEDDSVTRNPPPGRKTRETWGTWQTSQWSTWVQMRKPTWHLRKPMFDDVLGSEAGNSTRLPLLDY